jgi:hypothetical protein
MLKNRGSFDLKRIEQNELNVDAAAVWTAVGRISMDRGCKPDSVPRVGVGHLSILLRRICCDQPEAYPPRRLRRQGGRGGQPPASYLILLRMGLAMRFSLRKTRRSLTPPFHPYRGLCACAPTRVAVCFLWRFPFPLIWQRAPPDESGDILPCGVRTFLPGVIRDGKLAGATEHLSPSISKEPAKVYAIRAASTISCCKNCTESWPAPF